MFKKLLFLTLVTFCFSNFAQAAKRVGLVIGNDTYMHVPVLEKARGDARAISETLNKLGFDITAILDADRSAMNRAISTFIAKLQPGDTAFVFFAGHGIEIDGQNYLLPTNIDASTNASEDFIRSESIGLNNVLSRVQSTGARITLMFIDACRDNPFKTTSGRSIGGTRGLARITAPEGTFVVFSAGAGQQALDKLEGPDPDPNSVFTRTLLPSLNQPGLELRELISKVRLEVRDLALKQNHRQFPAYYDELLGEFYFSATNKREEKKVVAAASANKTVASEAAAEIQIDFDRVRSLDSELAYKAFLDKYSDQSDILVEIAKRRLEFLETQSSNQKPSANPNIQPTPNLPAKEKSVDPDARKRKEIILASQKRLNALGCSAGVADGVPGPNTRRAFRAFITATGSKLNATDFGSQTALNRLNAVDGTICKPPQAKIVKQKSDQTKKTEADPSPTTVATVTSPPSLAGAWAFRAKCPLAIRSTGTTTYQSLGGNRYSVVTTDNFGNLGKGVVTDIGGGVLAVRLVWQDGANDNYNAQLSDDRRTISGKNYAGCRFVARKQN